MRRTAFCAVGALMLAALALVSGCISNKTAVLSDGNTIYFCLGPRADTIRARNTNIYAIDLTRCRLRALTGTRATRSVSTLTPDGEKLYYEDHREIHCMETATGKAVPLKNVDEGTGLCFVIPGRTPHILAVSPREGDEDGTWVLFDGKGFRRDLLPEGYQAVLGEAAVRPNRAAIAACRERCDDAGQKTREVVVFVIDLTRRDRPGLLPVVREEFAEGTGTGVVFLDFSPDGRRLLACLPPRVYEVHADGKEPPRVRLGDSLNNICYAEFAPDGEGILCVYSLEWPGYANLTFQPKRDGALRLLAHLEGFVSDFRVFRWLAEDRLRMFELTDRGIRMVEVNTDGSHCVEKRLRPDDLRWQQRLADLEYRIRTVRAMPQGARRDAAMKEIIESSGNPKDLDKAIDAAWDKVDDWEEVPAKPEPPKPEAEKPPPPAP